MIAGRSPAIVIAAGVLLLLLMTALFAFVRRRASVARALGDAALMEAMLGIDLRSTPWQRLVPVAIAATALALALLDPATGSEERGSRGPVVFLLDASGSMLVEDAGAELARLDLQRELARSLSRELPDTPIGLVAFAGRAFSLTPPTRDRGALEMYLDALDPTIVTQSGSSLGAAIRQGIGLIAAEGEGGGTIVLFGDGDETDDADSALAAAELAADNGVRLHAVGLGSAQGGPVPALDLASGGVEGFLQDSLGDPLLSRRNEELLRSITRRGGGGMYLAAGEDDAVSTLHDAIAGEPVALRSDGGFPLYAWLGLAAFFLLLLEPLTDRDRRNG